MKKIALTMATIGFLGFQPALADEEDPGGLFVEPGVTYQVAKSKVNSPIGGVDGKTTGLGLGARLGFHISEAFFAGVDARYQMSRFELDNLYDEKGADGFDWGPVVGIQMPDIGLRVWAGYIVDSDLNPEPSNGLDLKFGDGKGFRVGAGFRVHAISLNLEYQDLTYGKTVLQQAGPFAPGSNFDSVELKNQAWIASVSFPLEI